MIPRLCGFHGLKYKYKSYHNLVIVYLEHYHNGCTGAKPLKFQVAWLMNDSFMNIANDSFTNIAKEARNSDAPWVQFCNSFLHFVKT